MGAASCGGHDRGGFTKAAKRRITDWTMRFDLYQTF
jgi:hypothetical protein